VGRVVVKNFSVEFFNNENIGNPPATSTRRVSATKLVSATLNWSCKWDAGVWMDDLRFNGQNLGKNNEGSADVTSALMLNGNNTVSINYSRWLDWFGKAGVATVTLDVVAETTGVSTPSNNSYGLSNWVWLLLAGVVVVVVVGWFLFFTPHGRGVRDKASTAGRDVYHKITGEA